VIRKCLYAGVAQTMTRLVNCTWGWRMKAQGRGGRSCRSARQRVDGAPHISLSLRELATINEERELLYRAEARVVTQARWVRWVRWVRWARWFLRWSVGDGSAGNKRGESCGGELMHVAVFCGANDKRQRSSAALTPVSQDITRTCFFAVVWYICGVLIHCRSSNCIPSTNPLQKVSLLVYLALTPPCVTMQEHAHLICRA